ncbi:hypothetical protein IAU60_006940 [Kwoniella sp. DSM 27419]
MTESLPEDSFESTFLDVLCDDLEAELAAGGDDRDPRDDEDDSDDREGEDPARLNLLHRPVDILKNPRRRRLPSTTKDSEESSEESSEPEEVPAGRRGGPRGRMRGRGIARAASGA